MIGLKHRYNSISFQTEDRLFKATIVAEWVFFMGIELKDFVTQTLKEIIDGVISAQEYAREKDAEVIPNIINNRIPTNGNFIYISGGNYANIIEFDIAVTASDNVEAEHKIGVMVFGIGAGAQGKDNSSNATVSRIKFSIPVLLPNQNK